jgi:CheY-like chemotaxis protein
MDPATRARVFEPFFTTKEFGKGTGLGLATVYGIIKQSCGHISVESEPGRGATFTVALPLAPAPDPSPVPEPHTDFPRGTETVLLVEDDDAVRSLASRLLRLAGYTVLDARHGIEALDLANRYTGPIHLLVTDVVMPHMSGRTLASILTSNRPDLLVMFLTGYCEETLIRSGDREMKVLGKPFLPKALAETVREVLDSEKG